MPLNSLDFSENCLGKSMMAKDWSWLDGRVLRSTLQTLNLSQNNVCCIALHIGLDIVIWIFIWIRSISFQLTHFPYKLVKLCNLTELRLKNNELTRIPFAIRRMKSLRNFILANNRFDSLPNSITLLTFETFDVSGPNMFAKRMSTVQLVDRATDALRQPKSLLYVAANMVNRRKYVRTSDSINFNQ